MTTRRQPRAAKPVEAAADQSQPAGQPSDEDAVALTGPTGVRVTVPPHQAERLRRQGWK